MFVSVYCIKSKEFNCKRYLTALVADSSTPSTILLRWDPVQVVKRGESVEYLLQSQCGGKDQDFVQVRKTLVFIRIVMHKVSQVSWLLIYPNIVHHLVKITAFLSQ